MLEHLDSEVDHLLTDAVARFEPTFAHYGVLLVFVAVLVEGFGVPAPAQTILIVGGVLAARGRVELVWLLLAAWSAGLIGNACGYVLGRVAGRRVLGWLPVSSARLATLEQTVSRHSLALLVVARFVDGLKQSAALMAGTLEVSRARFAAGTLLGTTLWVAVFGYGSYYLDHRFASVMAWFHRLGPWGYVLTGLLLVALLGWLLRGAKR